MKTKLTMMTVVLLVALAAGSVWCRAKGSQGGGVEKVYSVATDGFVNVRSAPNANSQVVGVLATGLDGARLLSKQGRWWKVGLEHCTGYVNSRYVALSGTPIQVSGLPEVYYVVVKECQTRAEVDTFFYHCPDMLDGLPVYQAVRGGETVYRICQSCHATMAGAEESKRAYDDLFGGSGGACFIWPTRGLARCVYLPMTPADTRAIPLTPQ